MCTDAKSIIGQSESFLRMQELGHQLRAATRSSSIIGQSESLLRMRELGHQLQATTRSSSIIGQSESLLRVQAAMQQLQRDRLLHIPVSPPEKPVLPPTMVPSGYDNGLSTAIGGRRDYFQDQEIGLPSVNRLPVDPRVSAVIEARLSEAQANLAAGSYLSAITLWGSVLEAVLLGAADNDKEKFNRASASPKGANGKVKRFNEWSLSDLINVAHEVNLIGLDVKKFAHPLRDFRNYIHIHQQIAEGFTPDKHTANICLQVLRAALAGIAGER